MFLLARPSLQVCGCHRDKKVKTSSPVMVMTSLPLASLQKGCAYTNVLNQPWPFLSLDTLHVSSSRVIETSAGEQAGVRSSQLGRELQNLPHLIF